VITKAAPSRDPVLQATALPGTGSPTIMRILLGVRLRRLREASRVSVDAAGDVLRASPSKISRLENGRVSVKDRDIVDLLALYGVTDEEQLRELRAMAARANSRGWWADYSDILPGWFEEYIGLEEAAIMIRGYEAQLVPGLLQTEDYARAVTLLEYSNPKEITRRVSLRMTRQAILSRSDPTRFWVVVDEAALRRPIGGPSVMRAQLKHLMEMSQRPNVTIQVMPFKIGGHSAVGGPFSVLHFAESDLSSVVYLEQLASSQYLDKPEMVDKYLAVMERLCLEAAAPGETVERLEAIFSAA
jgi:transcriptional regulator with XRE-family HTH domain